MEVPKKVEPKAVSQADEPGPQEAKLDEVSGGYEK
jgi:hypothetical protein